MPGESSKNGSRLSASTPVGAPPVGEALASNARNKKILRSQLYHNNHSFCPPLLSHVTCFPLEPPGLLPLLTPLLNRADMLASHLGQFFLPASLLSRMRLLALHLLVTYHLPHRRQSMLFPEVMPTTLYLSLRRMQWDHSLSLRHLR